MLRIVAYDISDPKRLAKAAKICKDYGVRVQFSLFECWLEEPRFQDLWGKLLALIDPAEDRIVAYSLNSSSSARRATAGDSMILSHRREACFFA